MQILRSFLKNAKISVILLDWAVRESFHSLDFLAKQTSDRSQYEVIWIEFYNHVPNSLLRKVEEAEAAGRPLIEQWIVLEAHPDTCFHKHYAYNVGIALAAGEICVICDSDAMFPENFIERIQATFNDMPNVVLHIDEVRNVNRQFYPFNYPSRQEVLADSKTINWNGMRTNGLNNSKDMLHEANYGACMAARRDDLIAVGGADEHFDYLGYICGPYEMTFRLVNFGRKEVWLDDIVLIHTWHPSEGGGGNLGGPHDGRGIALRALEARENRRFAALQENRAITALRQNPSLGRQDVIGALESVDLKRWGMDSPGLQYLDPPVLIRENIANCNIIRFAGTYYLLPQANGAFLPDKAASGAYQHLLQDKNLERLMDQLEQGTICRPSFRDSFLWFVNRLKVYWDRFRK